jgi:hypothetical protein
MQMTASFGIETVETRSVNACATTTILDAADACPGPGRGKCQSDRRRGGAGRRLGKGTLQSLSFPGRVAYANGGRESTSTSTQNNYTPVPLPVPPSLSVTAVSPHT